MLCYLQLPSDRFCISKFTSALLSSITGLYDVEKSVVSICVLLHCGKDVRHIVCYVLFQVCSALVHMVIMVTVSDLESLCPLLNTRNELLLTYFQKYLLSADEEQQDVNVADKGTVF